MANTLVTEEQVKKALQIDSFRNLSKDKVLEFVSMIPNMDKELAMKIVEQFPSYTEAANNMLGQLDGLCDKAMQSNDKSQSEAIVAYKMILSDLGEVLKKDNITAEERTEITEKMIEVADKIAAKDSEGKKFLDNIIKYKSYLVGGALVLGAAILGVNIKDAKLPTIKS